MKFALALAATASIIAFSSPVSAASWLITYKGHVTNGYDATGEFGTAGATLDGQAFTAVYKLVEKTGAIIVHEPNFSTITGTFYDGNNPLSANVTIKGLTVFFTGDIFNSFSTASQSDNFLDYDAVSHDVQDSENSSSQFVNNHINNYISSNVNNIVNSSDYRQNLNYQTQFGDTSYGYFAVGTYDFSNGMSVHDVYATLYNDSVTISPLNAVPEPASWALMITGFGLLGAAARGRRGSGVDANCRGTLRN